MTYKQRVLLRLVIIILLLAVYLGTFVFDNAEQTTRASQYTWLPETTLSLADRIEINGARGSMTFARVDGLWYMAIADRALLPVRQQRVEDLLQNLARRAPYPVRALSTDTLDGTGLTDRELFAAAENNSTVSGIAVRGGAGLPLLQLLVGYALPFGDDVYLRKAGTREIRSGADTFTLYTESDPRFWYDLKLFPETEAASVQGIVFVDGEERVAVRRSKTGWAFEHSGAVFVEGDSWARALAGLSGEDFSTLPMPESGATISLEKDDGTIVSARISPPDSEGYRLAQNTAGGLVLILSKWTADRAAPPEP